MKHLYFLITLALLISSCASTKTTPNPVVGSWDYKVYSTPNGDTAGTLVVTEVNGELSASFNNVDYGNSEVMKLVIEEGILRGSIFVADMYMDIHLTFDQDSFSGTVGSLDVGVFEMDGKKSQ